MSNAVTSACRTLVLPPTQKSVLMCLADYCHDDGKDWHSIAAMVEWTCLGRRTVIEALKGLEAAGLIVIERSFGNNNKTFIQLQQIAELTANQCASRTGAAGAPVQEPHSTSAPAAPPPVHQPHRLVRLVHPKHQEASVSINETSGGKARKRATTLDHPDDVAAQVWADWLTVRRAKRAGQVTATVMAGLRREAEKAGITVEAAICFCCEAGWQGFRADWFAERMAKRGSPCTARNDTASGTLAAVSAAAGQRPRSCKHTGFHAIDYRKGIDDDGRLTQEATE